MEQDFIVLEVHI